MDLVLVDQPLDFVFLALRWIHFVAGVVWIGLLYYFNFVQVPFFAETDAPVRTGAIVKLVPRALWWFRWGAMVTFLSGIAYLLLFVAKRGGTGLLSTSWGVAIQIGALLGTIMFLNVWLVIWPNQKVVIASTEAVAAGKPADPAAAGAGARAFLASRTNTVFSIPMLFFMGSASHIAYFGAAESSKMWIHVGAVIAVIALVELNALFGKKGAGAAKVLDKHVSVIHLGVALAVAFYFIIDLIPNKHLG